MQDLIVKEMVAAINALTREALCEAFKVVFASNAAVTALRNTEALGPLRAILAPIPTPLAFLSEVGSRVSLTSEDRRALDTVSLLLDMLGDGDRRASSSSESYRPSVSLLEMIDDIHRTFSTGMNRRELQTHVVECSGTMHCYEADQDHPQVAVLTGGTLMRGAGDLVPIMPEILPGVQYTVEMFVSQLLRKLALRFADDLDPATYGSTTRDQYKYDQRMQPGVTSGWASPGNKGTNDAWEKQLL